MLHVRGTESATTARLQLRQSLPFRTLVRTFRERAGLTQSEFAELSGVSVRALRNIESGRVDQPQARTLRALAGVLGLDVDDIRLSLIHI